MAFSKYFAYHVDVDGKARASYELKAPDDGAALSEARHFLNFHPSIEVWQGARYVGRMITPEPQ